MIPLIPRSIGFSIALAISLEDFRLPFVAVAKIFFLLMTLLSERPGLLYFIVFLGYILETVTN